MRNALTSLEQLIAFGGGHVTLEGAQNLLGSLDETDLSEIVLAIESVMLQHALIGSLVMLRQVLILHSL